jgi:hypothetical protein
LAEHRRVMALGIGSENICQSCGRKMQEEDYGRNADGSKSGDYCKYCFPGAESSVFLITTVQKYLWNNKKAAIMEYRKSEAGRKAGIGILWHYTT